MDKQCADCDFSDFIQNENYQYLEELKATIQKGLYISNINLASEVDLILNLYLLFGSFSKKEVKQGNNTTVKISIENFKPRRKKMLNDMIKYINQGGEHEWYPAIINVIEGTLEKWI